MYFVWFFCRLVKLLGHDFILKPQYDFVACDSAAVWLSCSNLTTALTDSSLIEASCPFAVTGMSGLIMYVYRAAFLCDLIGDPDTGGISLGLNWMCAVLYSLLNICTSASLGSSDSLSLINSLFKEKSTNSIQLNAQSFISSSYAYPILTEKWVQHSILWKHLSVSRFSTRINLYFSL